jgi:hypothetical protein
MEKVLRILHWPLLAFHEARDAFGRSSSFVWFFLWGAVGFTVVPSLLVAVLLKDPHIDLFGLTLVFGTMHVMSGMIFDILTTFVYGRSVLRRYDG